MTEYTEIVERHREKLKFEIWKKGILQIHVFDSNTTNMAYDYPNPRRDGYVEDITYNDGTVKRPILDTGEVLYLNEEKEPEFELLKQFKKGV